MADKKKKQKKEETPEEESKEKESNLIAKANEAAARLEEANKKQEELLRKAEALQVERTLSGSADAGTPKEKTEEEKVIESSRNLLKGTGFEDELFPQKE